MVLACWKWLKMIQVVHIALSTVRFAEAVFMLHTFQKKSKRGIALLKEDIDIIKNRQKVAAASRSPGDTQ